MCRRGRKSEALRMLLLWDCPICQGISTGLNSLQTDDSCCWQCFSLLLITFACVWPQVEEEDGTVKLPALEEVDRCDDSMRGATKAAATKKQPGRDLDAVRHRCKRIEPKVRPTTCWLGMRLLSRMFIVMAMRGGLKYPCTVTVNLHSMLTRCSSSCFVVG